MMFPRARAATPVALSAALLAGELALAPAAHATAPEAAPPCFGSTCLGKTPYTGNQYGSCQSTANDVPHSAVTSPDGTQTVVLRWSDWCDANWVKLTSLKGMPLYATVYWVDDGTTRNQAFGSGGYYSNMIDGSRPVEVCVKDSEDDASNCKGWF